MRLASILAEGRPILGLKAEGGYLDLSASDPSLGTDVGRLLASGPQWRARAERAAAAAPLIPQDTLRFRPVIPHPAKLLCLGLNDAAHAKEAGLAVPAVPEVFARVASSLIGHREPMLRPQESTMLDYEVELAVVIGSPGRRIQQTEALNHVAGYTVFNDGSIRDYQVRTAQWTLGKNFHGTGALGPDLVTPDELPRGAAGLRLTTRVGDDVLQDGDTAHMIFDVARTIALLSEAVVLEPGDVIAMGTPAGIGFARSPQRFLRPGEVCTVAIQGIGELANPIQDDPGGAYR
ncbi:MAG: fumarylacetoacetate hydrolase family protein [Myxococcales bacterium]|nr:fumarylacetoacetate hydrolase family protein [Myxococcales bacterium]MCB9647180.1 fumarylacetoacetate hydrolase family protein [Deltaproteobacteria bacterium]